MITTHKANTALAFLWRNLKPSLYTSKQNVTWDLLDLLLSMLVLCGHLILLKISTELK